MLFRKRERAIKRVLVVEDEPLVAFDNEYQIKDAGYEVAGTVDNLEDALRVIAEEHEDQEEGIDLILLDIGLNGEGSGIEVAQAAHAKGIAVLFVTGNCPAEAQHLAVGCLSKPYSDKVLKNAIDTIDTVLRGEPVKKVPDQLTLFEGEQA